MEGSFALCDTFEVMSELLKLSSSFNPRNKDAISETYLRCLEERLLDIEIPSKRYNSLTKDGRDAFLCIA